MYMQRTAIGAAGNGLHTTIKGVRGAAGIGLGCHGHHDQAPATHNKRHRGKRPGRNDEVTATHNERRREQWPEHHNHSPL
jgi:hypothetical protein